MQFPRDNQTVASTHSDQGLRNFYPWFLADENSSESAGYLRVVCEILQRLHESPNNKLYTFIRGDVNIFMPWMRVEFLFQFLEIAFKMRVHLFYYFSFR